MSTILITGSNTGIGYELVRILAEKGHTVYLSARNEAKGKEAQEKLKKEHNLNVKFVRIDVTENESIQAAKDYIEREEGHLDILVNNAGSPFYDQPQYPDAWSPIAEEVFKVNLFGSVQTTNAFLPLLRKSRSAVILNVSSTQASNTLYAQGVFNSSLSTRNPGSAYSAAKAALNSWTISLGYTLKQEGIRVNCATPGRVATKAMLSEVPEGAVKGKPVVEGAMALLPWILIPPEDVDKTIKFGGPEEWIESSGEMLGDFRWKPAEYNCLFVVFPTANSSTYSSHRSENT